ncbi:MAG: methyltransferase domain-containing protein [Chloroflexi bacterium]|nr:methyltransferase domain-containing protein [Chloroflexota bacterium]
MTMLASKLDRNEVVQVYTGKAAVYDIWGTRTEARARERALERAQLRDGEAVLEVAVGTGLMFEKIVAANPAGRNVGIDLTPAMLERAQARMTRTAAKNYELRVGDAYRLDFPGAQFDLLVNNYMFDLLPEADFPRVLQEFRRVLKPSGRLVLINMTRPAHWYDGFWEWVYRVSPTTLAGCRGVVLSDALRANGFQNLQREYVSQLGFPSEIITARV